MVLWLEKLNQIDSFCKIGILYAWEGPRSIERGKKHWTPTIRSVFPRPLNQFLSLTWYVEATYQEKLSLAWNVAATYQDKNRFLLETLQHIGKNWFWLEMLLQHFGNLELESRKAWNKQVFSGFTQFFVHYCASWQSLCTWHGYFEKKSDQACFFVAVWATETKVRHSTGVATTNSTNRNPNISKLSWAIN